MKRIHFTFILIALFILLLLVISRKNRVSDSDHPSAESVETKTAFVGIFIKPSDVKRRSLLRDLYKNACPSHIQMRFVMGELQGTVENDQLIEESKQHADIIILPILEPKNGDGKTYAFYMYLFNQQQQVDPTAKYSYVMKVDSNSYFNCRKFADRLLDLPSENAYYGRVRGGNIGDRMHRMGYGVTWDVLTRIAQSDFAARTSNDADEDLVTAKWVAHLADHGIGQKPFWVHEFRSFFEAPEKEEEWNTKRLRGQIVMHGFKSDKDLKRAHQVLNH